MGILVPPCILMIVIGAIANVSVAALFVAGFLPAVVLALAIMVYIYFDARRGGMAPPQPVSWREIRVSFVHALIPLGLPGSSSAAFSAAWSPRRKPPRSRCSMPASSDCSSIARSSGPTCRVS
jgi:TRAP-type C4-dicarboxylate transport system permease large subunit